MTGRSAPSWVKYAAKAITATVVGFAGAVSTAAVDGHITAPEWIAAAGTGLVALGAVFGVSNSN